jgi:hypothetical protein
MTLPRVRATVGLSGVLAGGLVALAVTVCLAQWLALSSGYPGPGSAAVVGHVVAALGAVVLQSVAQRSPGRVATLTAWSMVMLAGAVLWFGWWA